MCHRSAAVAGYGRVVSGVGGERGYGRDEVNGLVPAGKGGVARWGHRPQPPAEGHAGAVVAKGVGEGEIIRGLEGWWGTTVPCWRGVVQNKGGTVWKTGQSTTTAT